MGIKVFKDAFIDSKLSLVARDIKTKQIVAAILVKDWNYPLKEMKMELFNADLQKLISVFHNARLDIEKKGLITTKDMGVFTIISRLATHPDHLNRGLATKLVEEHELIAKKIGFKVFLADSYSAIS